MVLSDPDPYHYYRPSDSGERMEEERFGTQRSTMGHQESSCLPNEPVLSKDSTITSSNVGGQSPLKNERVYEESKSDRELQRYNSISRYEDVEERDIGDILNSIDREDDSLPSSIDCEESKESPVSELHTSMDSITTGTDEEHKVMDEILFKDSPAESKYSELERIRGNMEALKQRLQNSEVASRPHGEVAHESSLLRGSLVVHEPENPIFPSDDKGAMDGTCENEVSTEKETATVELCEQECNQKSDEIVNLSEMESDLSQAQILRAILLAEEASLSGASEFKTCDRISELDKVKVPAEAVENKRGAGQRLHYRMKMMMSKTIKRTKDSTRQVVTSMVGK